MMHTNASNAADAPPVFTPGGQRLKEKCRNRVVSGHPDVSIAFGADPPTSSHVLIRLTCD